MSEGLYLFQFPIVGSNTVLLSFSENILIVGCERSLLITMPVHIVRYYLDFRITVSHVSFEFSQLLVSTTVLMSGDVFPGSIP